MEKQSVPSRFKIVTPERKILVSLCYFVLLLIVSIPSYTLSTRYSNLFSERLRRYFFCEAAGVAPNNSSICDELIDGFRAFVYPQLTAVGYFMFNVLPAMLLIYAVSFKELKKRFMKKKKTQMSSHSEMRATRVTMSD